jgi:hypothetical protein
VAIEGIPNTRRVSPISLGAAPAQACAGLAQVCRYQESVQIAECAGRRGNSAPVGGTACCAHRLADCYVSNYRRCHFADRIGLRKIDAPLGRYNGYLLLAQRAHELRAQF